ncbi:MAG: 4-hydroxythreonine-4-phosphate dehydrogenase PdxA [Haliscomenobacter sp.]|nr:4-hydroxythreonine-4-phosphate dehydrogenase PdxA [Haliscomenobacter sp.]MBK9487917.1 4-hydroxythreonine-4-phosphate dehydrogenase PdxA [Haliscomenobacter sp.]
MNEQAVGQEKLDKLKIGISIGDINGIGLEVIIKTLSNPKIINFCVPVLYGSSKIVSYHKNIVGLDFLFQQIRNAERVFPDRVNVVNCWQENVNIVLGKPTDVSGKYAYQALEWAVKELKAGYIDALVTAPINKEAMQMANFPFPGHTEYLTQELANGKESLMLMVSDTLRIGVATNHLPLREVAGKVSKELISRKLKTFEETLRVDFGIDRPIIAVLGMNPHAGDGGVLGDEDDRIIRPAIIECKKNGMLVMGPFPADGFFGSGYYKKFDGILAIYHDQGLIPFKLLAFGSGINYTAGLSAIRTSPDHGTAYDIAGKNEADPDSFREALFMAIELAKNRKEYYGDRANALVRRSKIKSENGVEEEEEEDLEDEIDDVLEEDQAYEEEGYDEEEQL